MILTHANVSHVFSPLFGCLFFCTISQKLMQLGSPNFTQKCSTRSLGNSFILWSEGQRSRSRGQKYALLACVLALCALTCSRSNKILSLRKRGSMFSPALVCVCLSVTTITKNNCGQIWTKFHAKVPKEKGKTKFVFRYDW